MWDEIRRMVAALDAGTAAWLTLSAAQRDVAYTRWQEAYAATPAHLSVLARQRLADQSTCAARIADADVRDRARDDAYAAALAS